MQIESTDSKFSSSSIAAALAQCELAQRESLRIPQYQVLNQLVHMSK